MYDICCSHSDTAEFSSIVGCYGVSRGTLLPTVRGSVFLHEGLFYDCITLKEKTWGSVESSV